MTQTMEATVLTLKEVIDVVPASCRQRSTPRGLALVGRDLLLYALVLTGIVLSPAWWVTLPLVLLAGLTVAALFVLGHDAAHGVLTDDSSCPVAMTTAHALGEELERIATRNRWRR